MDGAGKDTVAAILATLLRAHDRAVAVRTHPSANVFGRFSKAFLVGRGRLARTLATGFFGLDALTSAALVGHLLRRNDAVIFVRYLLSASYLPEPMARPLYDLLASFVPEPEVKVYVDTRPETALARIRARAGPREMFENPVSLASIRRRAVGLLDRSWVVIDNNGSVAATRSQLERLLPRITGGGRTGRRARRPGRG